MQFLLLFYHFAFFFYLYFGIRVFIQQSRSALNRSFLLLSLSLVIWALGTGYMITSETLERVIFWRKIAAIGYSFMPVFFLLFFMVKTRFKPLFTHQYLVYLLPIPAIVYLYATFFIPQTYGLGGFKKMSYGWTFFLSTESWLDWFYNIYFSLYFFIGLLLLFKWYFKTTIKLEKRQAGIILISLVPVVLFGSLTDIILPVFKIPSPPIAALFTIFPYTAMWYVIEKYRFMGLTAENIVSDILKNLKEGLLLLDTEGKIQIISDEGISLLECQKENLIEHSFLDFLNDHNKNILFNITQGKANTLIESVELMLQRCEGESLPVLFSASPIFDRWGDLIGHVCSFRDMRPLRKAEAEKNQIYQRLRVLVDTMQQGILFEDSTGKISYVNAYFCGLFGISVESTLIGRNSFDWLTENQEIFKNSGAFLQTTHDHLKKREIVLSEIVYLNDGRIFERDYIPITQDDKKGDCYWIYRDITEKKKAEEKLRASLHEREILILEIHHRVKNNLQLIHSLINFQQNLYNIHGHILNGLKSRIRAISLVHDKLFKSTNMEAIDLSDYLKDLISYLSMLYKKSRVKVQTDIESKNISIPLDQATPLSLIVNEIISIMYKYSFKEEHSGFLNVSCTLANGKNQLIIHTDNTFLAQDAKKDKEYALGMKIINVLVDQLQGNLEYDISKGTTFCVTFPILNTLDKKL